MKIQPQNPPPPPTFKPLTIILETPEEVAKLFAIFNFMPITDALGWNPEAVQDEMYHKLETANEAAGNKPIDYEKWHGSLCKAFDNKKD